MMAAPADISPRAGASRGPAVPLPRSAGKHGRGLVPGAAEGAAVDAAGAVSTDTAATVSGRY